eukprot:7746777-Pyramimonas_sp.AAC.1
MFSDSSVAVNTQGVNRVACRQSEGGPNRCVRCVCDPVRPDAFATFPRKQSALPRLGPKTTVHVARRSGGQVSLLKLEGEPAAPVCGHPMLSFADIQPFVLLVDKTHLGDAFFETDTAGRAFAVKDKMGAPLFFTFFKLAKECGQVSLKLGIAETCSRLFVHTVPAGPKSGHGSRNG